MRKLAPRATRRGKSDSRAHEPAGFADRDLATHENLHYATRAAPSSVHVVRIIS